MPDILVIGSLNADLVVKSSRFPEAGETISGEDLQIIAGGKGANQAVAVARQGISVAMVGRVGNDSFGDLLIDNLKKNNVDVAHVKKDSASTGTAVILVDANGQNRIVLSAGANGNVSVDDIDSLNIEAKILLLQLEIPIETVIYAAKWGKKNNMLVILNPAPAKELPDELIQSVDFIVPNESELSLLTSKISIAEDGDGSINQDGDGSIYKIEQASKSLLQRGAKNVIVTLGQHGTLIVTGKQVTHVNTFQVDVVDTTAAGDAFIGGFASKLLESVSLLADVQEQALALQNALQNAVRYGCACGALAVTKFGAQPSLPTKEEVEKFISS